MHLNKWLYLSDNKNYGSQMSHTDKVNASTDAHIKQASDQNGKH